MDSSPIQTMTAAQRPAAQGFDEIRLITVPRFKTSGLSGDEWRISATIQFWRHGRVVYENGGGRNIEMAVILLGEAYLRALDDGHGFFTSEGSFCDQEGCREQAILRYRLLNSHCRHCGQSKASSEWCRPAYYRQFCQAHRRRGNSDFTDRDDNYEVIWEATDESQVSSAQRPDGIHEGAVSPRPESSSGTTAHD